MREKAMFTHFGILHPRASEFDEGEVARLLALEMSYVPTTRITKQDRLPPQPDPYSVLAQEARGTREMITSDQLPRDMSAEDLTKIGVEILRPSKDDHLFNDVKLPQGWKKVPSRDDPRTTHLVDDRGNIRAYMWYKGASYDRKANGAVYRRFDVVERSFDNFKTRVSWVVDNKTRAYRPIFQSKDFKFRTTKAGCAFEAGDKVRAAAVTWLRKNFPNASDCSAYWDIEDPATMGEFPAWNQDTRAK